MYTYICMYVDLYRYRYAYIHIYLRLPRFAERRWNILRARPVFELID